MHGRVQRSGSEWIVVLGLQVFVSQEKLSARQWVFSTVLQ